MSFLPEPPRRRLAPVGRWLKKPSTLITAGSLVLLGGGLYWGGQYLVTRTFPQYVETELSRLLQRPVKLGAVKTFNFHQLRLGPSTLPPTATEPTTIKVDEIALSINPLGALVGQPIQIAAEVTQPVITLKQNEAGQWFRLDLAKGDEPFELPTQLAVDVTVKAGKINLYPQGSNQPLSVQVDGSGSYSYSSKAKPQKIAYDLGLGLNNSAINLKGNTELGSGESQVAVAIEKLNLPELLVLLPSFSGIITQGNLQGDVKLSLPNFEQASTVRSEGLVRLSNLQAKLKGIKDPLNLEAQVKIVGQTLVIDQGKVQLGPLQTFLRGKIDWQRGYDLALQTNVIDSPSLLKTLNIVSPVPLTGKFTAQAQVKGALADPQVRGRLQNQNAVTLDRVKLQTVRSEFQANLEQLKFANFNAKLASGGEIRSQGQFKWDLQRLLNQNKSWRWQTIPIQASLKANLAPSQLLDAYGVVLTEDIEIGNLQAQGNVSGTLGNPLAQLNWQTDTPIQVRQQAITAEGQASLRGQTLALQNVSLRTNGGEIRLNGTGSLKDNRWQSQLTANQFALSPLLATVCTKIQCPEPLAQKNLTLEQARLDLQGTFSNLDPDSWQGDGYFQLRDQGETATINANLRQGVLATTIAANNLGLSAYLPSLATRVDLRQGTFDLTGRLQDYLDASWDDLSGQAKLTLAVAQDLVQVTSDISRGQLTAIADVGQINFRALVPDFPLPAKVRQGQISLVARLGDLLRPEITLGNIQAIANFKLAVAGGTVNSQSTFGPQGWKSQLQVANLNVNSLLPDPAIALGPLNLQLQLQGTSLEDLTQAIPVQIKSAQMRLGQQQVQAQGTVILQNLLTQPQIVAVNLQVNGQTNLAQLRLNTWVDNLPLAPGFRPKSLKLAGLARFSGNITGKNVQSIEDIILRGKANLTNLVFNQAVFESQLQGPFSFSSASGLALQLKGKEDVVALNLKACQLESCLLPYLPTQIALRQTYQTQNPLVIKGRQSGDRLRINVDKFPLALLNLELGRHYNVPGTLTGQAQAQMTINLKDGSGRGTLKLQDPALGPLGVQVLTSTIDYRRDILQFKDTSLQLGQSNYDFSGSVNLKTQAINGRLRIAKAKVDDLLTALRISDVDSVLRLLQWQLPSTEVAQAITPLSVGNPKQPLEHQLNLLYIIDQQIRLLAQQFDQGGVPKEFNIEGLFDFDLALSGTLKFPQINMQLQGEHWSWYPQPSFPNIVPPLGLVLNNSRFLPIQQVNLQAQLRDGKIEIRPSFIEIKDSRLALQGTFSEQKNALDWSISNLSLDTLNIFARLPADLTGILNAQGRIEGKLTTPQVMGSFSFSDPSINARPIKQTIVGQFSYTDERLQLRTDPDSPFFFSANIPLSLQPVSSSSNAFDIQLRLQKEALQLVGILTQDQLIWLDGDGAVNLGIKGNLALNSGFQLSDFEAQGQIRLDNAQLKSAALNDPLQVSGVINFDDKSLSIEDLAGTFAQSSINVRGVLPLFAPVANLDTPLSISINKATLDVPTLYAGDIEGLISVTGTAFRPQVGGYLQLANGQVLLQPQATQISNANSPSLPQVDWFRATPQTTPLVVPEFENLRIRMDNLYVEQAPFYVFSFAGNLNLNGPFYNLDRVRPDGEIILNRGRISFLDTRFLLDPRNKNSIIFAPNQGLLNPDLNVTMRTIVSELPQSQRIRSADRNEIPDDSINKIQRVDIRLNLNGSLNQLLPQLNAQKVQECSASSEFKPLPGVGSFSDYQLRNLSNCLQILASHGFTDKQFFSNPAIKFTSSPPRTEGEIVRLLGEQVIVLVDAFQGKNSSQLLQVGITQLAIPMVFQGLVYDLETTVSNAIGSTDFRVVPFLETIYEVEKQGYIRFSYDYSVNEVRVRYEKQF